MQQAGLYTVSDFLPLAALQPAREVTPCAREQAAGLCCDSATEAAAHTLIYVGCWMTVGRLGATEETLPFVRASALFSPRATHFGNRAILLSASVAHSCRGWEFAPISQA